MKKHLLSSKCALLAIMLMCGIHVSAYDFYAGGIYYDIGSTGVTVENKGAFNTYSGNVTIPETVSYGGQTYNVIGIGYQAFKNCTGLTSVTLPNTVYMLLNEAFAGCTSLTTITLPASITAIYNNVFVGCTGLSSIYAMRTEPRSANTNNFDAATYANATLFVPEEALQAYQTTAPWSSFTHIQKTNFDFVVDGIYYKKTSSNTVEVTYKDILNNAYSGNVTIPSTIKVNNVTYTVKGIGIYAFYLCTNLTSVSLPNTITIIDGCAFEKCSKLTSITIPNSVTTLGVDAFASCTSLQSIDIPNSVTKIDQLAFSGCTAMTTATLGSGVTSIAEKAFSGCSALTSITCLAATPPTMKNNNCFDASTYSSATLNVPGGSLNAYKSADWWRMFSSINALPFDFYVNGIYYKKTSSNTVEVTYKDILAEDYSGSVTIPSSIKVNNVTYSVTAIGMYAMYMCKNLTSITMPNTITKIDACAFEKCSGLTNISIPNSVTYLGIDAFSSCTGLKSIIIPNSVTAIDDLAFYNCSAMTTASIGSGVKTLGEKSFYGCTSLAIITCMPTTPPTMKSNNCFSSSTYNSASLCVPRSSLNAYKTADWWRMFVDILGMDSGSDPADVNGDGEVNIADVNAVINAILSGGSNSNADVNGDGEVNIADVNAVITAILG